MNIGEKEIVWGPLSREQFKELFRRAVGGNTLSVYGIMFPSIDFGLNVSFDNPGFKKLLNEKFGLCPPYNGVPHLTFIRDYGRLRHKISYKHYGYISETMDEALVLASSFGMFKSTISGYASLFMEGRGYVPAHASVLSASGKGILLAGGSAAGKTTALLNLVDWLLKSGKSVGVLTDDWAIVAEKGGEYIAKSFDPSISLRQNNLSENQHLRFYCHEDIQQMVATQEKISRSPEDLYGRPIGVEKVVLSTIILLLSEEGDGKLHPVNVDEFARAIVGAAYHYPYVSIDQIRRHESFWVELAQKLPVFSFSTRGHRSPSQSIDVLKELIYDK